VLDPDEQFRRNHDANKAYRNRQPLSPAADAANRPCAEELRRNLTLLAAGNTYDAESIKRILVGMGLTEATARPPGRLDLAGSGGLLFAGWTGQACVFGEYGPNVMTIEYGSMIADGGCLPAPG
jgi:hypothetical protein